MDNSQSTKMPKPFDNTEEYQASAIDTNSQQFQLHEDDRLKQEDDYRQGYYFLERRKIITHFFFSFKLFKNYQKFKMKLLHYDKYLVQN